MKMDGYQNKGVAGGAFCKRLKRKGIDGGKSKRSNRVAVENKEREGVYPPVAKESVRKGKKIKGICSVPLDDDGGERATSD
jgi:hypothetical protein